MNLKGQIMTTGAWIKQSWLDFCTCIFSKSRYTISVGVGHHFCFGLRIWSVLHTLLMEGYALLSWWMLLICSLSTIEGVHNIVVWIHDWWWIRSPHRKTKKTFQLLIVLFWFWSKNPWIISKESFISFIGTYVAMVFLVSASQWSRLFCARWPLPHE